MRQWDQNRVRTNRDYLLYVEDNAGADRIWIDLGSGSDFEMTSPAFLNAVELKGGNIHIFRRGGLTIE